MADSAGVISSKNSDKSKLNNSVQRTTSETLRITETEKAIGQPNSLSTSTPRKKTSFQITSVTVGSRTSNDGGDDSADDLDESHTEDISEVVDNSRITDLENETPSYSEDTFSKDDVFFNASSSLVSAPVIPTSSQYGLAILATPENSENPSNHSDVSESSANTDLRVEVTESVINLGVVSTKHDPEMRDMHPPAPRTERFKVVKIESTEPFKRGRWVCMDYLDHNIAQNQVKSDSEQISTEFNNTDSNNTSTTTTAGGGVSINNLVEESQQPPLPQQQQPQIIPSSNHNKEQVSSNSTSVTMQATDNGQLVGNQQLPINTPSTLPAAYTSVSPGQSLQNSMQMQSGVVNAPQQQPQVTQQSQSLSQVHMQQILANSNQHQSLQPQQIQQVLANAIPVQQQQQQPQQQPQQQQQPPQQQQQQQQQPSSQQQTTQQPSQQQQQQQPIQTHQQQPMIQQQQPMQQMPQMHQPQFQQSQPQQQPQQPMQQQQYSQPIQQQQQPQQMMQQQMPQQTMQPPLQPVQQVHMQQIPMQQQMTQPMQQMPQQQVLQGAYSQALPMSQPTVATQSSTQPMMQAMHPQMQSFQQSPMMTNMQPQPIMNIQSQPHLQPQYYTNTNIPPQNTPLITSQGGMLPPMSQNSSVAQVSMQSSNLPPLQTFSSLSQQMQVPNMPQTPPVQTSVQYSLPMSMPAQQQIQQPMSQTLSSMPMQQQPPPSYSHATPASQTFSQVSSVPSSSVDIGSVISSEHLPDNIPAPTAALLESLQEVTASPEEPPSGEDPESASGASAVAIDNKIEQAMDLVKSHLMFAVREEVEVLKEKIAELMERISQLESENNILRAGASPETLALLPPPQPPLSSNPT
ncbi:protein bunched, class 2/F/G isoform-like isoform X2 [Cimex lectularius]|uniref:Uncharacterized protein n=1 Tax=Cimex lectularius TaxID=79782 RepID=A0A8I6RZF2_CIMLE|nr:protein bunched, class 2/F/G isoform-like isoform X2 [Cimex lectularius]